jgi:ARG and Rhodanese-Phosphatase-superfamily-associated Protein domain
VQRIGLAAGSLAAAAVLLVAAWVIVPTVAVAPADDTPDPAIEASLRLAELAPGDVAGHLELALWCEEQGLTGQARGLHLRVLSLDRINATARAALGLDGAGEMPGMAGLGDRRAFRNRLDGIPLELDMTTLADASPAVEGPQEMRIPFAGDLIDRRAMQDFIDLCERERLLAARFHAERRSIAPGPGVGASANPPHPLAVYMARLEPVQPETTNRFRGLTLLPIRDSETAGPVVDHCLTVSAQLFDDGMLSVEDTAGGVVVATNHHKSMSIFIPAGTIFVGVTQDRVTRRDILVSAGRKTAVPSFCCERGKMARKAPFDSTSGTAGPGLRRLILCDQRQSLVWSRIRNQAGKVGAVSKTQALRAIYRKASVKFALKEARAKLLPLLQDARVVGFVAADGERILGADVFGSHELFMKLAESFLDSYVLDSLSDDSTGAPGLTPERARAYLQRVLKPTSTPFEMAGVDLGTDVQFEGDGFFAYGLSDGWGRPIHVSLFPIPDRGGRKGAPPAGVPETGTDAPAPPPSGADVPRKDPSEAGRRIDDRREGVREGAPKKPKPINPPPPRPLPGAGRGPDPEDRTIPRR